MDDLITRCPRRTFQAGGMIKIFWVYVFAVSEGRVILRKQFKCKTITRYKTIKLTLHVQNLLISFKVYNLSGVPTVLEKSLNFGFSLKSP